MNGAAHKRVTRARSILIQDHPFFGVLALNLEIVERPDVGTMATDGARLFYAPEFVMRQPERKLLGTVAHEAFHCALDHVGRIGGRDLMEFNIAADLAINPELIRMGFELPDGVLLDSQYADMAAEEIYAARAQKARKEKEQRDAQAKPGAGAPQAGDKPAPAGAGDKPGNPADKGAPGAGDGKASPETGKPGAGAPGAGAGAGDKPSAAEINGIGGIMRPGDGSEAAARAMSEKWQVLTRQAVAVASKQAGDMPGMFKRILGELDAPRLDARHALADFIDSRVAMDYSFLRPNRRFAHAGLILPGAVVDGLEHLVFIVDSSGSIDAHMLEQAAANVVEAIDAGKVQRLTVIFADTDVRNVQEFERGDDIAAMLDAKGGGGTRFDRALTWVEENAPDATAVIYLTDMECRHFGRDPGMPVLWAIHGDSRKFDELAARAPFGTAAYIGRLE